MHQLPIHFRNGLITILVVALVMVLAGWGTPDQQQGSRHPSYAAPLQQGSGIVWVPGSAQFDIQPGQQNIQVDPSPILRNTGTTTETLDVSLSSNFPPASGWSVFPTTPNPAQLTLFPGIEQTYELFITAPANAAIGDSYIVTLEADNGVSVFTYNLVVNVVSEPPTPTTAPMPTSVDLSVVGESSKEAVPGKTVIYTLAIRNPGTGEGTFDIFFPENRSCSQGIPGCTESRDQPSITLEEAQREEFQITVVLPPGADAGQVGVTVVRAELQGNPDVWAEVTLTTTVLEATATPTRTPTPTDTPTPLGRICTDIYEGDNEHGDATFIEVNVPQPNPNKHKDDNTDDRRSICPPGDEDWIKFAAIGGKVYTIDISAMADGIDLTLELFDEAGRSLAFNDDYFPNENETIADEKPDIRSRIDSWRAPVDGIYYIRVRDAAGRGGIDRTYTIQVLTESYGPTPITVPEECLDLFEPDGLPEQSALIISNERQRNRSLCPAGDADWVTFFGKKNKRYFIYTETAPYEGQDVNYGERDVNGAQAGADTVMVLTDRDGVSVLKTNDDIPGGDTPDSQIEFTPKVDGFYYVQIKNVGDIGNQFIRYNLVLELCRSPRDPDCGRRSEEEPTPTLEAVTSQSAPTPQPTVPTEEFSLDDDTAAAAPPPAGGAQVQNAPADSLAYSLGFSNDAFWSVWQRNDQPVNEQRVARRWLWGPEALVHKEEPFRQAPGGSRQVQYFENGRMEINDPSADPADPWFVTFGLLAQEMVNSQIQVGQGEFLSHQPATIPLVGDPNDPNAPTYASFQAVLGARFPDLSGEYALDTLDRAGSVGVYNGTRHEESRLSHFVAETGHNIPLAFWRHLNAQGEIYAQGTYVVGPLLDWQRVVGYPLSEPYWVRARLDGVEQDVLVQVFQRRVLSFVPARPPGEQVEMSKVGRHYYQWRYGQPLP